MIHAAYEFALMSRQRKVLPQSSDAENRAVFAMQEGVNANLKLTSLVWLLALLPLTLEGMAFDKASSDEVEFFETRIRPVLVKHCYECHSAASAEAKGGLLLDSRDRMRTGGESGEAIVPGKPSDSLLLSALKHESFEMPPAGRLPDQVIADFEYWIRLGAVDPRDKAPSAAQAAAESWKTQLAERRKWWSLQPPEESLPPEISNAMWSKNPVDHFIHAALDQAGLGPAEPAGAEILLRRLSFVLTGLPPKPDQVNSFQGAFARDEDQAVEELVDELLNSPHFGERFARHWMDVVRYTDTYGYEWDIPARGSWEYRDYLTRAFNDDVGFDQLIREQIAGDLLSIPRINKDAGLNESLIGPMFYHFGEHRHGSSLDFNGIHQEMINNKIDAFSKAFLGMTVACARCHDHKLDAVSQADYYALAGVFMTARWTARSIDAPSKHHNEIVELKRLRHEIQQRLGSVWASPDGPLSSGALLKSWAYEKRDELESAKPEDIAWPFARLIRNKDATTQTWQQLATRWRNIHRNRTKANAEQFQVLSDFKKPGFPEGWVSEGDGINHGYVTDGTMLISLEGDSVIEELLPQGYHTHALSSRLAGAIRLPDSKQYPRSKVSLRLTGGEWAGYRTIPQNAFLSEGPVFFDPEKAATWTSIGGVPLKNGVTRGLTEITTASLNSNFPPRTGVATAGEMRLPDNDEGFDKRSWFSVTGIVAHDDAAVPSDTLDEFASLYGSGAVGSISSNEAWQRLSDWLKGSVRRWITGQTKPGDVKVLNWLLSHSLLPNSMKSEPDLASLIAEYRKTEAGLAFPRSANSMDERSTEPVNYRLNVRGNVNEEGPEIPRGYLDVFAGTNQVNNSSGSGRLELAQHLSSRQNPQTARVYVNRVWQWVFGTGIVSTPNDFGKLGDRPSHPKLLDWLAIQFMKDGWSTKKLIRRLILSRTFRQSGRPSVAASRVDAENRLLSYYPTRRLEAEAIRDSLLAVSGKLDPQLYGRPINPPRLVEDSKKRLFSGPLDSNGRRSMYIEMSIMEPPDFLVGFNLPDLKLPTGRRDVTNVPAQALIMLNDPLVIELSEDWAVKLVDDHSADERERIHNMFIRALGRHPARSEIDRWVAAATSFSRNADLMSDREAWAELAHALFNTKEFIYYR